MPNAFYDKWTATRKPWENPLLTPPATAPTGGAASLPGFTQGGMGPFGSVPQVPNPVGTAGDAIAGNLGNLSAIHNILNDIDPTVGTRRGIIDDKLAGRVPEDVEYLLAQRAAERGVGGGSVNADFLKALGLTSLGIQREGGQEAGALANEVLGIQSPMFVTPDQMQQAQYLANVMASSPDPAAAAAAAIALQRMGFNAGNVPTGGGGGGSARSATTPSANVPRATSSYAPTQPSGPGFFGGASSFNPGPGFGGEEFDVPFAPSPTGASYPWAESANQISGLPTPAAGPTDFVSARTGSQFDYSADDYGTGWANFPGFEFMNEIAPAQPSNFVEARTGDEYDWQWE